MKGGHYKFIKKSSRKKYNNETKISGLSSKQIKGKIIKFLKELQWKYVKLTNLDR